MKLSEMKPGTKFYTALAYNVLAVLSVGVDGYRVYVGAVPGKNHDQEWPEVAGSGDKQSAELGKAIVELSMGYEVDIPYAR